VSATEGAPRAVQGPDAELLAGARLLAAAPFVLVSIEEVRAAAGTDAASTRYASMHELGSAVLDHERGSMHAVQARVTTAATDPLDLLRRTFHAIGELLADDAIVRAGIRIAFESREHFPERRLDPFATWSSFAAACLTAARAKGLLRPDLDVESAAWVVVAASIGTKDYLALHDRWPEAPERFDGTLDALLPLLALPRADGAAASIVDQHIEEAE